MLKFATISPTDVHGKKLYAWEHFKKGNYIAFGAIYAKDLSRKTDKEIIQIVESIPRYKTGEAKRRIREYLGFMSLNIGDYVAVNNTNDGLFGIGTVTSGYYFKKHAHDTGSTDPKYFYCHFYNVKWLVTQYMKRKDILRQDKKGWAPYGIIRVVLKVPDYIMRIVEKNK